MEDWADYILQQVKLLWEQTLKTQITSQVTSQVWAQIKS
jgi:hypothetical protein